MVLTPGSRGDEVRKLQTDLNTSGERLTVDGVYGNITKNAVERFQQSNGLGIDGVAGDSTLEKLAEVVLAKKCPPLLTIEEAIFDKTLALSAGQYIYEESDKEAIVLHDTEGATAASSVEGWAKAANCIATAYIIERDGTIYEIFDPKYWAWHLGSAKMLKIQNAKAVNKRTIGIELANEGPLALKDGKYYCFDSNREYIGRPWNFGNDEVVVEDWRDCKYWAAYPTAQQKSAATLVRHLCNQFNIPKTLVGKLDYDKSVVSSGKGIFTHATVRTDKQDLHPGFNFDLI